MSHDPAHTTGASLQAAMGHPQQRNQLSASAIREHDEEVAKALTQRAVEFATQGRQLVSGAVGGYQSVAGKTPPVLEKVLGTSPERTPLTILDFIDARVREIDAERNRLSEVRQRMMAAGLDGLPVEDLRRLLG